MNLGTTEVIGLVGGVLALIVNLWALVDLARRPAWAFEQAEVSRSVWLILLIVGIFVCGVGMLVALWYLFIESPKVRRQQRLGPSGHYHRST